ncbi:methylated-DNA--[protein]-cysteine S-methyltransferase [Methylibium sp.]|uniref:methylated-DNA--[protein]-cysteine S-methyltransferase n=1 Tax=Methylibium sp. TaxID=2067992 RepID=UPI003D0F1AE9
MHALDETSRTRTQRRRNRPWPALRAQARAESPLGPLTLAATDDGLAGLWFDGQKHHPGELGAPVDPSQRWLATGLAELEAYWRDGRAGFTVALDPQGTPFQRAVWDKLRAIAPGQTWTYGALARQLGRETAVRAVAAAVGRNPLSIIVPCHRVLGSTGALTGYAGGLDRKAALLKLEGARP